MQGCLHDGHATTDRGQEARRDQELGQGRTGTAHHIGGLPQRAQEVLQVSICSRPHQVCRMDGRVRICMIPPRTQLTWCALYRTCIRTL